MDKKRDREYREKVQERSHAVVMYLKNLSQGKGVTKVDQYFGKRELARLRGVEFVKQLKANPDLVEKLKKNLGKKGEIKSL